MRGVLYWVAAAVATTVRFVFYPVFAAEEFLGHRPLSVRDYVPAARAPMPAECGAALAELRTIFAAVDVDAVAEKHGVYVHGQVAASKGLAGAGFSFFSAVNAPKITAVADTASTWSRTRPGAARPRDGKMSVPWSAALNLVIPATLGMMAGYGAARDDAALAVPLGAWVTLTLVSIFALGWLRKR